MDLLSPKMKCSDLALPSWLEQPEENSVRLIFVTLSMVAQHWIGIR